MENIDLVERGDVGKHTYVQLIHATAGSVMGLLCYPHNFLLAVNCYIISNFGQCIHDHLVPKSSL